MKIIKHFISFVSFTLLLLSQSNKPIDNAEIKRKMSDYRLDVVWDSGNILKVTDKINGGVKYYDTNDYGVFEAERGNPDYLLIDLSTTDTSSQTMYRWWQDVPISAANSYPLRIFDGNNNGYVEMYGYYLNIEFPQHGNRRAYEFTPEKNFKRVVSYPESLRLKNYGDIENDGLIDIAAIAESLFYSSDSVFIWTVRKSNIYSALQDNMFPFDLKSEIGGHSWLVEPKMVYFIDLENNGIQEVIYYYSDTEKDTVIDDGYIYALAVMRYDSTTQSFSKTYKKNPREYVTGYYMFGDFNNNGKVDIQTGGIHGKLFMFSYEGYFAGKDSFTLRELGVLPAPNLYYQAYTNDVNGNGKQELWIGGAGFFNGKSITKLFIFESINDTSYSQIFQIDIQGLFSLDGETLTAVDINNDGIQEVVLAAGGRILIFGYNKKLNTYELVQYKRLFPPNTIRYHDYTTFFDIDDDGFPEMFICTEIPVAGFPYPFTVTSIYKYNTPTGIQQSAVSFEQFRFEQNYPNPFNNTTRLSYSIPKKTSVTIKIYDLLGKEIITLLENEIDHGNYNILWNGKSTNGKDVTSGVYFARLQAGEYQKTIKILLQK